MNHVRTTNRCRRKQTIDEASSYRTYAGHWKQRDEPDEEEQYRQAERINQVLKAQRQKASRERLKQQGAVPTKNGKKLFDEFMKEASQYRLAQTISTQRSDGLDLMQNLYNASSALDFQQWMTFADYELSRHLSR